MGESTETMTMGHRIFLGIEDARLSRALTSRLEQGIPGTRIVRDASVEDAGAGDIVVTTAADCAPVASAELAARGVGVIVLTPVLREAERAAYASADALAYLVMGIESTDLLIDAIKKGTSMENHRGEADAIAPRAAAIHAESPRDS